MIPDDRKFNAARDLLEVFRGAFDRCTTDGFDADLVTQAMVGATLHMMVEQRGELGAVQPLQSQLRSSARSEANYLCGIIRKTSGNGFRLIFLVIF